MNGVSGVQGSGSAYSSQQTDQAKQIRFENALAAARTAKRSTPLPLPPNQGMDEVDFASVLPSKTPKMGIPETKMIQSLNRLVKNQPAENYGSLDIRQ